MPYFAAILQNTKRLGHLIRLHQRIGPMQQQNIQIIGREAIENAIDRRKNMRLGEIKASWNCAFRKTNAAF